VGDGDTIPRFELDRAKLATLLRRARRAHELYERRRGTQDEHWAEWYAGYVLEQLKKELDDHTN
jgi:hypothetical protein